MYMTQRHSHEKNDKIIKQLTIIIVKQYYNHYTH